MIPRGELLGTWRRILKLWNSAPTWCCQKNGSPQLECDVTDHNDTQHDHLRVYLYTYFRSDGLLNPEWPGLRVGRSGYKAYYSKQNGDRIRGVKRIGGVRLTSRFRAALLPLIEIIASIPPRHTHINLFVEKGYAADILSMGWPDNNGWRDRVEGASFPLPMPEDDITERLAAVCQHRHVTCSRMQDDDSDYRRLGKRGALKAAAGRQRPADRVFEARTPWVSEYLAERASTERPYEGPSVAELMESEDWQW